MQRFIFISILLLLTACGGGGGGVSSPASVNNSPPVDDDSGDNDNDDEGVDPALAHCATPTGSNTFTNVTTDLGLCYDAWENDDPTEMEKTAGGLGMADIDNDGMMELYVAHGHSTLGRLFSYDGETFVERETNIELLGMDLAGYFVDIDADGFKDFISNQYEGVEVFKNNGNGDFEPWTDVSGINHLRPTWSMAAGDYNLDGDLDLFFTHWGTGWTDNFTEYLWDNAGMGTFVDQTFRTPIATATTDTGIESAYTFTPVFADYNNDGYPDLLLANDFGSSQVLLSVNNGNIFVDDTTEVITDENGMGNAVADYDRDGDLDWFVTSIYRPETPPVRNGNRLYRNNGVAAGFEDVTDEAGVREGDWGWGACFADFDNDGHLDLFHTNGHQEPGQPEFEDDPSRLFMSNGDGTFTDRATELGLTHTAQGRGLICTDYNTDGKVDVFIANNGNSPTVFRNDHDNDNHFIGIDLIGIEQNLEAIGARVTVRTASGEQIGEVQLGNAYLSHGPATLHFGLGQDDVIESIDVWWPGSDPVTSRIENIIVDQYITIEHPTR
jgi:hypothetical protein